MHYLCLAVRVAYDDFVAHLSVVRQQRLHAPRQVNINTMCELGSGGVSLTSMARRTLGVGGMRAASATYLFLHYALLVACASLHSSQARATSTLRPASPSSCSCSLFVQALPEGLLL